MKGKGIGVLVVLLILVAVLFVLVQFRDKGMDRTQEFGIIFNEGTYFLKDYDLTSVELIDFLPPGDTDTMSGYTLPSLAELCGLEWETVQEVYLSSDDGSKIKLSLIEATQGEVLLVPFKENPLRFRVVFPLDEFRNRWLKNIYLMELL